MTSSRTLLLAVLAVVAALIGPASASAGWFSIDENGNTTPNGHGNAPTRWPPTAARRPPPVVAMS